jgi:hypothetical protein
MCVCVCVWIKFNLLHFQAAQLKILNTVREVQTVIRVRGVRQSVYPNNKYYIHIFPLFIWELGSRDSAVGIATGYGLDDRGIGIQVPAESRIFSSPRRPDRLWDPPNLLSNGYLQLFPRGLSGRGVKLITHLQLVPKSRKYGSIHPLPHTPS